MFNNAQKKLICVFGLGQSGLSVARYLQRIEKDFVVVDSRSNPPGQSELDNLSHCKTVMCGNIEQALLNNSEMIVLSPGVSPNIKMIKIAKESGVSIIGDIELFAQNTNGKIVAITGSNGKSTVTDLTCQILKAGGYNAAIGGNFGVPALDYLPDDNVDIYVLELSSFQLDTTYSLRPDVAVVLNVSEDHMDRYESFTAYRYSKLAIYEKAACSLVNLDDPLTLPESIEYTHSFSLENKKANFYWDKVDNSYQLSMNGLPILKADELLITGLHNWSNLLACLGLVTGLGIEITPSMINKIKQYKGLPHRYQLVSKSENIDWVNDSKATNVGATKAALNSVDRNYYTEVILIAGGEAKEADLSPLKTVFTEKVSHFFLMGKDARKLAGLVDESKVTFVKNMQQAVRQAKAIIEEKFLTSEKTLVLLSPACASLDMFRNFEERGQEFVDAIKECA
ncbi:UDP-N-acetylmuramoyl-L-alanine--D-glutamate ligase [Aliikangiella sp. IMCC44359]|uniref:UDP-N-acetylmuramoyl-L-alanine--D-glutamate ligase n=1 Tax=Aliikangiella sp. IMCC44359 TaxID=3459125 RepID=UPI00403B282B